MNEDPRQLMQASSQLSIRNSSNEGSLWEKSPAWRNLTVAASLLTLAAVAVPAFLPEPENLAVESVKTSQKITASTAAVASASNIPGVAKFDIAPTKNSPSSATAPLDSSSHAMPKADGASSTTQPPASLSPQSELPLPSVQSLPPRVDATAHEASSAASTLPVGTIIVSSGILSEVNQHNHYNQGHDWPITITVISGPAHGTLTTEDVAVPLTFHGVTRITAVKRIYYKSNPNYAGTDTFTYKRTSADGADPLNANTYTMNLQVGK